MDYIKLKSMILTEPSVSALVHTNVSVVVSGKTAKQDDQKIADFFNEKSIKGLKPIKIETFMAWWFDNGLTVPVLLAANDPTNPAYPVAAPAVAALRFAKEMGLQNIDFNQSANVQMLDGLLLAGLISSDQYNSGLKLAEVQISIAEKELGRDISAADVSIALRG